MNVWHSGRESKHLDSIRQGRKTIEGRLRKSKFKDYKVGDQIRLRRDFRDENGVLRDGADDQLRVRITDIHEYKSFEQLFQHEDFKNLLPDATSVEEAKSLYEKYYSLDEQKKYGVLAIYIKPLL